MKQLVHWLTSHTLFGPRDKIIEQHTTAWCLAKIIRLIGPMDAPDDLQYKDEFILAQDLADSNYEDPETGQLKPYIGLGSLRDELEKLPRDVCSRGCIDFLEHLLVIDPTKRPTAREALQHPFVRTIS
jgi:serine/threonine protein kinase